MLRRVIHKFLEHIGNDGTQIGGNPVVSIGGLGELNFQSPAFFPGAEARKRQQRSRVIAVRDGNAPIYPNSFFIQRLEEARRAEARPGGRVRRGNNAASGSAAPR